MSWDPFGDLTSRGILRNKLGTQDPRVLADMEFLSVRMNMPRALDVLRREKRVDLRAWRRTHAVLFGDIYPWAGKLRHLDVQRGQVRFNTVGLIEADSEKVFAAAAQNGFLGDNLG